MATYYIDTTGNDTTGNGSIGNPWASLYKACTEVSALGDIIHVNAGTYTESNKCELSVNINIDGDGSNVSIIQLTYANSNYFEAALQLIGGDNTSQYIRNITFDGDSLTGYQGIGVYSRSNVEIYNCIIKDFRFKGALFGGSGSENNSIHDCTIDNSAGGLAYGFGDEGMNIQISLQTDFHCYNNIISQASRGDNYNGVGIGGYEETFRTKIYNNEIYWTSRKNTYWNFAIELWLHQELEIYDNYIEGEVDLCKQYYNASYDYTVYFHDNEVGWTTVQDDITLGLQFEAMNVGIIVSNNKFFNVDYGVYFCNYHDFDGVGEYVKDVWVYTNVMYGIGVNDTNWGAGIYFECGNNDDDSDPPLYYDNINIWNNTIVANSDSPARYGIDLPCHARNTNTMKIQIANNIIVGFSTAGITAWRQNNSYTAAIDNIVIANNVVYGCGNSNQHLFTGVTITNFLFSNLYTGDPLLVSGTDLHLQSVSSSAYHLGTEQSLDLDYEGKEWSHPPSIGAYEFGTSVPPDPQIKNLANTGWHIPTDSDWGALSTYLGGWLEAGGHLKEIGFTHWHSPNTGADDSVGFSAYGSGWRTQLGNFQDLMDLFSVWVDGESDPYGNYRIAISNNTIFTNTSATSKISGHAIRLIKDDSNDTGHYQGNDGKVYLTVKIGDQVWMKRNLAETRYRDGTVIPQVQPAEQWIALTTGALCAYDNDWNNAYLQSSSIPYVPDADEWIALTTGAYCVYDNDESNGGGDQDQIRTSTGTSAITFTATATMAPGQYPAELYAIQMGAGIHIRITWEAVTGVTGYLLQRMPQDYNGNWIPNWKNVYAGSNLTFDDHIEDEGVMVDDTHVTYRIAAYSAGGVGHFSPEYIAHWYA